MEENDLRFIQDQIGYNFRNLDLLQQAFVRRSYSNENGGQNNEVLEFIGDKVLDYVVVQLLCSEYGRITEEEEWHEYVCQYTEGQLTEKKKRLVEKSYLAKRIQMLDLEPYLIMGKNDRNQGVQNEESVQEDLFEAILGAIAIDSNWDAKVLKDAVEIMLNPDENTEDDENYVALIQEWTLRDSGMIPLYHYEERSYSSVLCYSDFNGITQHASNWKEQNELQQCRYACCLKICDDDDIPNFRAFGRSKSLARKAVCKMAYEYLEKNNLLFTIRDEIEEPCKEQAINQLEILARRGYFELPTYDFSQSYDENGNPIWCSKCMISGKNKFFKAKSSSKKEAKKQAAFKMLQYVLADYE